MSTGNDHHLHAFSTTVKEDVLAVSIHREFDFGGLAQDWAHAITASHPGPFREVRVDMSATGLVSSTFFAGLVRLRQHYTGLGQAAVVLVRPDPRNVRNLAILHLDQLFTIEPR